MFQTLGIIVCVLTMIFGIINVIVGAVTTGDTRSKFYPNKHGILCGRRSSRFVSYNVCVLRLLHFYCMFLSRVFRMFNGFDQFCKCLFI